MKALFYLISLLPVLSIAGLTDKCHCPEVKCPGHDKLEICKCLNKREDMCKKRCPEYVPTYMPCPPPGPTATPKPTTTPCECENVYCPMIWPDSCHCKHDAKEACYEKCGGEKPGPNTCPPLGTSTPVHEPTPTPPPTLITHSRTRIHSTPTPTPTGKHTPCGGFRVDPAPQCGDGFICIDDPFDDGCGLACDRPGICVKDKMCGGFGGFECEEKGMVCVDDPRDDCDPNKGGADCGGLCVWKH